MDISAIDLENLSKILNMLERPVFLSLWDAIDNFDMLPIDYLHANDSSEVRDQLLEQLPRLSSSDASSSSSHYAAMTRGWRAFVMRLPDALRKKKNWTDSWAILMGTTANTFFSARSFSPLVNSLFTTLITAGTVGIQLLSESQHYKTQLARLNTLERRLGKQASGVYSKYWLALVGMAVSLVALIVFITLSSSQSSTDVALNASNVLAGIATLVAPVLIKVNISMVARETRSLSERVQTADEAESDRIAFTMRNTKEMLARGLVELQGVKRESEVNSRQFEAVISRLRDEKKALSEENQQLNQAAGVSVSSQSKKHRARKNVSKDISPKTEQAHTSSILSQR